MLVFVIGPPAVGKMTVGHALADQTGLRLFHNHHTIDLVLRFFAYGTPPFQRLVGEFRRRLFEEVAASELPGLVFTYVWAFDDPREAATVEAYAAYFLARGGRVVYVELEATQAERLRRNETEFRLAEKPSKRDLVASRHRLLEGDARHQLNSRGAFDHRTDWLRLDTTDLPAAAVAERIIAHFALPRSAARHPPLPLMPSDDAHRLLIERYVAAYNAFDVPGMLALLHPDVTFQNLSAGQVTASARGLEEFRQLAERAATLFSSRRQTVREYVPDGDGARVTIDYEGVLAADLGPDLRAGETLRLVGHSTFRLRDGYIAHIVDES
jgi:ketosteroid isomerase-like protein